jgi:hypothetical protein
MNKILSRYETSDIVLAACLKISNYEMVDIEKNGNKGIFVFHNVDESYISDYDLMKVRVEPVALNNTIKQLTTSVRRIVKV